MVGITCDAVLRDHAHVKENIQFPFRTSVKGSYFITKNNIPQITAVSSFDPIRQFLWNFRPNVNYK